MFKVSGFFYEKAACRKRLEKCSAFSHILSFISAPSQPWKHGVYATGGRAERCWVLVWGEHLHGINVCKPQKGQSVMGPPGETFSAGKCIFSVGCHGNCFGFAGPLRAVHLSTSPTPPIAVHRGHTQHRGGRGAQRSFQNAYIRGRRGH